MTKSEFFEHVFQIYQTKPDFPWEKYPGYAVFRHADSKKWFALFMEIDGKKLSKNLSGKIETVTVKTEPNLRLALLDKKGVFEAYHMNKNHWITIALPLVDEEDLKTLLDISFELTK